MIRIGMCDDNLTVLNGIAKILESELIEQDIDAEITIITNDQNIIYEQIKNQEIDILFLDIDFKNGKNGIDFALELRKLNKNFYLIFVTAFQRYIQLSLTTKVFDYLIKPINREVIHDLCLRLNEEFKANTNLFLHINKWISIRTNDILYIEKMRNQAIIYTERFSRTTYKTLEQLLEILPENFVRCHRSFIINTNKIVSIDRKLNLAYFINERSCPINSNFILK